MTPRLQGIVLMLAAIALFALLDAAAKYAMHTVPAPVAVFFRYAIALGLCAALILAKRDSTLLVTRHPGVQALRGVTLMVSTFCNFTAIGILQLAQTAAISFTIPLWVCALSIPLLGETVGPRRWAAILAGFCGVLIIMRPGTASFHPVMLLSLAAAFSGAIYNIATRKVGGQDRVETSLLYAMLVGSLGALLPLPSRWLMPEGMNWAVLGVMGVCGCAGHLLLIQAHRLTPASVLAPFVYTQIIWMIALGFLVFGDVPDVFTLLGGGLVIASGIYVFARERALGKSGLAPAPED